MTLPHTERKKEREVAQLCPTLCDPMDSSLHQAPPSMGFSRHTYLVALCLSCGMWDLVPQPGIQPGHPALGVQCCSHWTTREIPKFEHFRYLV